MIYNYLSIFGIGCENLDQYKLFKNIGFHLTPVYCDSGFPSAQYWRLQTMDKDVKCPMTNVLPGSLTVNNLQPPVSNRGLLGLVDE